MANVNELITRIRAVDQFSATMNKLHRDMAQVQTNAHRISGALRSIATPLLALTGAGATGFIGLAFAAARASAEWEQLAVTMESVTGSAETAQRKLQFVKELAVPALATENELAAAALQLEAMGVNAERALPMVAKLQAAFQFDPQALDKASSIIGRLAQGDFPDIELLSGMGLNKLQFRQQGIIFDSQGKMLSSAREAMDALDRIVAGKYGDILDKVANTATAKLATLTSRWNEAMRGMGKSVLTLVMPVIERLTTNLQKLTETGELQRWGDAMLRIFRNVGTIISLYGALILGVVALLKVAFKDYLGAIFAGLAALTVYFGGQGIQRMINKLLKGGPGIGAGAPSTPPPAPTGDWGQALNGPGSPAQQTARNTRMIAENTRPLLDWSRVALGGGPLGQIGITPVEISGAGGINVTISGARSFENMIADIVQQTVTQMRRQRTI